MPAFLIVLVAVIVPVDHSGRYQAIGAVDDRALGRLRAGRANLGDPAISNDDVHRFSCRAWGDSKQRAAVDERDGIHSRMPLPVQRTT